MTMSRGGYKGPKWDSLGHLIDLLMAFKIVNDFDLARMNFMAYMDRRGM